jgi:transglycosylase-like protein with SLT domain
VPDLIAAVPTGITQAQLAAIGKLSGVRAVFPVSGGEVTVNGKQANVIGVAPQAFRSWTPPQTAADVSAWTGLDAGDLLASRASAGTLGLARTGVAYPVAGATAQHTSLGAVADLGLPGVDAVVDTQRASQLGLVQNVAALINAPGDDLAALMAQIRKVLGPRGEVRNLVTVVVVTKLPVATVSIRAGQVPANWLQLYQDSAQRYCSGLSWTILAAIGEIESGDGANEGPSTAGALGPMQFMPGTWAIWGMDGFSQAGKPDVWNPYDAVASAARMLCADGALNGATGLSHAIFDYNHADWYVSEVLELADEYAQAYA